jgi:tRNA pseudouridine55 synthase
MTFLAPCMDHSEVGKSPLPSVPHGVLIVNKPDGWTSHDVVKRVRTVLGIQKVGHAGTLDPHATGVLPVLIGKGTKIAQYLLDWDKEYAAVLQLGQATDTQDAWGTVLAEESCESLTEDDVRSAFMGFHGPIQQVPPMYSAVKVGGQPLYKKARKGQTVERQAKTVVIHDLEIQRMALPEVSFRVACSKGTYVRTICADIGDRLGVGGHLKWLQRQRVGPLYLDQAVDMESLNNGVVFSQLDGAWWSLDQVLKQFPAVEVNGDDARKVLHGNAIPWNRVEWAGDNPDTTTLGEDLRVRVKTQDGLLLALGTGPSLQSGLSGPVLILDTVLG